MDENKKALDAELELDDELDFDEEFDDVSDDDAQEDVVDSQDDDEVDETPKKKQPRDEQSAYARLRKKAEADAQKKLADELATLKAEMLAEKTKKQEAEDEAKWEAEAEEQGLPIDFYKKVKRMELALEQSKKKKSETNNAELSAKEDLDNFRAKYPDVDINKVISSDPRFRRFSRKTLGSEPLTEIWADYTEFIGETETAALKRAVRRAERSTSSADTTSSYKLTAAQRADLDQWNKENPSMKMTAKEFLQR